MGDETPKITLEQLVERHAAAVDRLDSIDAAIDDVLRSQLYCALALLGLVILATSLGARVRKLELAVGGMP